MRPRFTGLPLVRSLTYLHRVPQQNSHEKFMRAALLQAKKGLGTTSPNPAVGVVLVWRNRIIARGHHRRAGGDHAEIDCLGKLDDPIPAEAVLYVTLEPCSTRGRTAPCANYIIQRGVRRVIIGAVDPNPKHRGRAIGLLHAARVDVRTSVLEDECTRLNEAFSKWIVTGEPFVIAKCGMSLDGYLTRPAGETRWLTSESSRSHAHQLRALVEGGGNVLSQALDHRLIDKVQIYLAPIFTGGGVLAFGGNGAASTQRSLRLDSPRYQRIGQDICITGYPKEATDFTAE